MPTCVLRSCKSRASATNEPRISLFSFPLHHRKEREVWINYVRNERREEYWLPSSASRLCAKHFKKEDINIGKAGRQTLKKSATPFTLNFEGLFYQNVMSPMGDGNLDSNSTFDTPKEMPLKLQLQEHHYQFGYHYQLKEENEERKSQKEQTNKKQKNRKRKKIKTKKILRQNRYFNQKCLSLRKVLDTLQQKISLDKHLLEKLNARVRVQEMYENLKKRSHKLTTPRQHFSPNFRKFALILHYYCPAAYKYVRKTYSRFFPPPMTLRRLYSSANAQPGFTVEAFKALKMKRIEVGKELLCSLVFDEMSIRRQKLGNNVVDNGFVDLGFGGIKDEIASQALVFMVVSINQNWKIPVGYFFINNVTAEQKTNLIKNCLIECHKAGVKIISMALDGCPTNLDSAELLGCNLKDPENLKTKFPHPITGEKIVIFLDPTHMIKLVRSSFENKKNLYDNDNDEIKWSLLVSLNKLQSNEQLNFGNKLTSKHIHFRNEIMKVRLATQLLSGSVAKALLLCNELLRGRTFKNVYATITFISIMNVLFDVMNSTKYSNFNLKQPLCIENANAIFGFLNHAKTYILSLNVYIRIGQERRRRNSPPVVTVKSINKRIVDTRYKTGFLGFLINIQSLQYVYETFVKTNTINCLSADRLNQDHLKLFFGCIRRQSGHHNNPNIMHFKAAYKKILNHLELRDSFSGNCAPIDNFTIAHYSPVNVINGTSMLNRDNENFEIDDIIEKDFQSDLIANDYCEYLIDMLNERSVSDAAYQIIGCISGFVTRTLMKKIKCEECVLYLVSTNRLDFYKLISIWDLGGLCYPSRDVFEVCKATEALIRKLIKENEGKGISVKHNLYTITSKVLKVFLYTDVFHGLLIHSLSSPAIFNHRLHLIRAICETYAKIRLRYVRKLDPKFNKATKGLKLTKLILLQGI